MTDTSTSMIGTDATAAAPPRHAGTERGFALLEVVIAFIIAGVALGVLFHESVSSLRSIQAASRYEEAVSRARSRLAIATHGAPLTQGDMEGEDGGGYHWRVHVAPMSQTAVRPVGMRGRERPTWVALALYNVSVQVTWTERGTDTKAVREVRLDTQHLQASAK